MYSKRLLRSALATWRAVDAEDIEPHELLNRHPHTSRKRWYMHLIRVLEADVVFNNKYGADGPIQAFLSYVSLSREHDFVLAAIAYLRQNPATFEVDAGFAAARLQLLSAAVSKTHYEELHSDFMTGQALAYQRQAFRLLHAGEILSVEIAQFRDREAWNSFMMEAAVYSMMHDSAIRLAWQHMDHTYDDAVSYEVFYKQIARKFTCLAERYWLPAQITPAEYADAQLLTQDLRWELYAPVMFGAGRAYCHKLAALNTPSTRDLLGEPHHLTLLCGNIPEIAHLHG